MLLITLFFALLSLVTGNPVDPVDTASIQTINTDPNTILFPFDDNFESRAELTGAFALIEAIPDALLDAGDDAAVHTWIEEHSAEYLPSAPSSLQERQLWIQIAKCVFEIGKMLAENAFPVAKLRRLKDLVKGLGGAYQVAKKLIKAKKFGDLKYFGGSELVELGQILLGGKDVIGACFSF